jgi:hypothetical protein
MRPPTWLLIGVAASSRIWISRSRSLSKSAHSEAESGGPKPMGSSERVNSNINYIRQPLAAEVYGSPNPGRAPNAPSWAQTELHVWR